MPRTTGRKGSSSHEIFWDFLWFTPENGYLHQTCVECICVWDETYLRHIWLVNAAMPVVNIIISYKQNLTKEMDETRRKHEQTTKLVKQDCFITVGLGVDAVWHPKLHKTNAWTKGTTVALPHAKGQGMTKQWVETTVLPHGVYTVTALMQGNILLLGTRNG